MPPFYKTYISRVSRRLLEGKPHARLGLRRLSGESPAEAGRAEFQELIAWGLAADSCVVDYGCGSLRVGQHLIRYLDPGCYWGLDVTDEFYRLGLPLIEDCIDVKRPNLHVIDPHSLALARDSKPAVIFSSAVMSHVPPSELATYFGHMLDILDGQGVIYVNTKVGERERAISEMSWVHSLDHVKRVVGDADAELDVLTQEQKTKGTERFFRSWLRVVPRRAR